MQCPEISKSIDEFSLTAARTTLWGTTKWENISRWVPACFLYVLPLKYMVSSAIRLYSTALIEDKEQSQESFVLSGGTLGSPWLATHRELVILHLTLRFLVDNTQLGEQSYSSTQGISVQITFKFWKSSLEGWEDSSAVKSSCWSSGDPGSIPWQHTTSEGTKFAHGAQNT